MKKPAKKPIIGVIGGRGALGSVLVRALEKRGNTVLVSERVQKPGTITTAALLKKSDIVIVSVPLLATVDLLKKIVPRMRKNQLLCDVTSVKELPLSIMRAAPGEVVGLHPLFGPVADVTGLNCYYCPVRSGRLWRFLHGELRGMGLSLIRSTASAHDKKMTAHQSLHHLLLLSCAAFLARREIDVQTLFAETTPSMRLMLLTTGRLLAADPNLYKGIEFLNPHTVQVVEDLRQLVDELAEVVERRDDAAFDQLIGSAARHFGDFSRFAHAETSRLFIGTKNAEQPIVSFPEKKTTVKTAILGPATQTELAAAALAQNTAFAIAPVFVREIGDVFTAVKTGRAALGVVPLENYQIGPVRATVKELFAAGGTLRILAEISRPIAHALLAVEKKSPRRVLRIFAHPQAAAQCRSFLQKHYPTAEIVETAHTGESVARAAGDTAAAAIGPQEAAKQYGLVVVHAGIEDDPNNRTRFVLIGKKAPRTLPRPQKTALAFHFKKDAPGNLAAALQIFAAHGINLTRIESIPTENKIGSFFFFTEAVGDSTQNDLRAACAKLSRIADLVRLGSYGTI